MSYWVNHLMGNSEIQFPLDSLSDLYTELSGADNEHTDVSLTHESEWCISAFQSGLVVFENVAGEGEPKHIKSMAKENVIALWQELALGNIKKIEQQPWLSGYGS